MIGEMEQLGEAVLEFVRQARHPKLGACETCMHYVSGTGTWGHCPKKDERRQDGDWCEDWDDGIRSASDEQGKEEAPHPPYPIPGLPQSMLKGRATVVEEILAIRKRNTIPPTDTEVRTMMDHCEHVAEERMGVCEQACAEDHMRIYRALQELLDLRTLSRGGAP